MYTSHFTPSYPAEILALHESDTLFTANKDRGIQLYPSCVQIRVTSNGNDVPPGGASWPGAYQDTSPGIHFNLYSENPRTYKAPGPAVWSGAKGGAIGRVVPVGTASPTAGPVTTSAAPAPVTTTSTRAAVTPTSAAPAPPATTTASNPPAAGVAALYGQCGGQTYKGPTACPAGSTCTFNNGQSQYLFFWIGGLIRVSVAYYSQCIPSANFAGSGVALYGQCGGVRPIDLLPEQWLTGALFLSDWLLRLDYLRSGFLHSP